MSSDQQAAGPLNGKFMRTIRNSYVNRNRRQARQGRHRAGQCRAVQGSAGQGRESTADSLSCGF